LTKEGVGLPTLQKRGPLRRPGELIMNPIFVSRDPMDVVHEACGVFGIYNNKEAARLTYLGLQQLQHRGQESAGIVSSDGKRFYTHVSMGLVADVFQQSALDKLKGRMAIGHVRYATAGASSFQCPAHRGHDRPGAHWPSVTTATSPTP
jgi:glutamate synthase domain-containing protein 1